MTRLFTLRAPRLAAALLAALALTAASIAMTPSAGEPGHVHAASRTSRSGFHDAMRVLWEDHIVWTRVVIISVLADAPDADAAVDRLLANQDDIGAAIAPFYGAPAGEALASLLREHITGAAALLGAAKAGDPSAIEAASGAWYANGDEIAGFLAAANPKAWPLAEMRQMMRDHLDLTLTEALARLEGRWADDVAAYDAIHQQILHMADMLSDGIIAQFPGRFGRAGS